MDIDNVRRIGSLQLLFFVSAGKGHAQTGLTSFDSALCAAGLGNYNLVKVSSILPPGALRTDTVPLEPGALLPTAYTAFTSDTENEVISACVGIGIPSYEQKGVVGVIMESSGSGQLHNRKSDVRSMVLAAMKHRAIPCKAVLVEGVQAAVHEFTTVIAAVALIEPYTRRITNDEPD